MLVRKMNLDVSVFRIWIYAISFRRYNKCFDTKKHTIFVN